jgi:hypothetical protein
VLGDLLRAASGIGIVNQCVVGPDIAVTVSPYYNVILLGDLGPAGAILTGLFCLCYKAFPMVKR